MDKKPLKRHKSLQPLSREHHHNLLLSWKIRTGISKGVSIVRIRAYADWFYTNHILPHFNIEEAYVFPVLGEDHELVKRALTEHRRIKRLFTEAPNDAVTLNKIEEEIEKHVRFEERILFPEIQLIATEAQMEAIDKIHNPEGAFVDKLDDEFWR
ncbi:MAG: hemerythrin domain-containing protein [Flavobacteriaceae bacterium]